MFIIQKSDIVQFGLDEAGQVVGVIDTGTAIVYRIRKIRDNQIIYLEERMVQLQKQSLPNAWRMYAREAIGFLRYTFGNRFA